MKPSIKDRIYEMAMNACAQLRAACRVADSDSVDWNDVDLAHELACKALATEKRSQSACKKRKSRQKGST